MEVSAPDFLITSSNDRGRSWGETETRDLIKIWADDTIQAMLNGLTFNHKVFVQISEVMKCRGYDRNPKQCREKIKKLRLDYKKIVGEKKNGSEKGETTWKFFEAMHEVLGRPAPTCGRNSAAREEEDDDDEDDEEDYYDDDDDETTTSEDEEEDGSSSSDAQRNGRRRRYWLHPAGKAAI
ncbi:PREDICTED: glutamic acid-rich protein-like [Cyprinodon variegatus]|uniref:glutamic acid-rich protein-like n=1 Tax=Cyprinodon variegatus TaxID=28743 RepID=UPI000742864D|nr:PREDICTED: glutamic acid-rich protein-like [Cyprinodon variegatus]